MPKGQRIKPEQIVMLLRQIDSCFSQTLVKAP